jgi:hypothetical protein
MKAGALWKWRGCGKGGKPKAGFPPFPRAPWESRQIQARFPHFHSADDGADGKVENQKQVFHFPTALFSLSKKTNDGGGRASPVPACRHLRNGYGLGLNEQYTRCACKPWALVPTDKTKKGAILQQSISGSSRIGIKVRFQAHPALESNLDFRLISGLENARQGGD